MKLKTIFKVLIFLLLGLILAAIIAPIVFKDRIIEEIKKLANEHVEAKVEFADVDLSLIKSFPNLNIQIKDLSVTGIDQFEGQNLFKANAFNFDMNIKPLFNQNATPKISYVGLDHPEIDIQILDENNANFNIIPESEEEVSEKDSSSGSGEFELALDQFEIIDGQITLVDHTSQTNVHIKNMGLRLGGNFTQDVFDMNLDLDVKQVYASLGGTKYLNNIPLQFDAIINADMANQKFTFKDNSLELNKLKLLVEGFTQIKGDDIVTDIALSSPSTAFSEIFSTFPFVSLQDGMDVNGKFDFDAKIKGIFNSEKSIYPATNINLSIDNGIVKYPDLPFPVKDINTKINVSSNASDLSDLRIDIPQFHLSINNEVTSGRFVVNKGMSDPEFDGALNSNITLENWKKALPLEGIERLNGKIKSDLSFGGRLSDIEAQRYDQLSFEGQVSAKDIDVKNVDQPAITADVFNVSASPEKVVINSQNLKLGRSQLSLSGFLTDPLAVMSDKISVKGAVNMTADKLDLNEWMTASVDESAPDTVSTSTETTDLSTIGQTDIAFNLSAKEINYDVHTLKNTNLKGRFGNEALRIDNLNTAIGQSDLKVSGIVKNPIDYAMGKAKLQGSINIESNNFDTNPFMKTEEATTSSEEAEVEVLRIPKDIEMSINTNIKRLKYTDLEMKNFRGSLEVKDQAVALKNVKSNVLSGSIAFDGLYDSKEEKPSFDTKLDLSQIKFSDAYQNFLTVKTLAPIAKYIEGFFNTTLVFSGNMGEGMVPDFNTLNASGYIETLNSTIKNAKPIQALADKLNVKALNSLKLEDTKNWFEIKNGTVELKESKVDYKNIKSTVKGSHKISGDMDYIMMMSIPREELKKNSATAVLNDGLSFLEGKAKSIGLDIDQGANIDLKVNLKGTFQKPKISITPVGTSGKGGSSGSGGLVDNVIDQTKGQVQKEVDKKKEEVVDTLKKSAQKEVDKAKEQIKSETNKVIDKTKKDVSNKVKDAIGDKGGAATDTVVNKVLDEVQKNTGKNVDDIKDQIKDWNPFKKKKKKKKKGN